MRTFISQCITGSAPRRAGASAASLAPRPSMGTQQRPMLHLSKAAVSHLTLVESDLLTGWNCGSIRTRRIMELSRLLFPPPWTRTHSPSKRSRHQSTNLARTTSNTFFCIQRYPPATCAWISPITGILGVNPTLPSGRSRSALWRRQVGTNAHTRTEDLYERSVLTIQILLIAYFTHSQLNNYDYYHAYHDHYHEDSRCVISVRINVRLALGLRSTLGLGMVLGFDLGSVLFLCVHIMWIWSWYVATVRV